MIFIYSFIHTVNRSWVHQVPCAVIYGEEDMLPAFKMLLSSMSKGMS